MSNKALFFTTLLASVVFLGGMTISETCLAQSHANNTKANKQDVSPGGVNAEQHNNTNQDKRHMSPGGVNAEQYNNTNQNKRHMSPGGVKAEQHNNTNQDKRHMSPGGVTAEQQGESKLDLELTQKIRQAVVKNKDLSMNAHNVKIITIDGVVTLKGPVASEQEKKAVEELAAQVAGESNIKSDITIAP
ncbi:MAG: BON domain-containing protein [Desulfomicrobium sp.]|nr:BON domain-containing protein [Desulfomicrobium sp.]